ncbi:MAG: hypothetical protein AB1Z18_02445 [Desulfobacterales bacterium]
MQLLTDLPLEQNLSFTYFYDQRVIMADTPDRTTGIKLLIQNLKKEFRIPENLEHYSEEDFQEAEKKYLKFCLQNGCNLEDRDLSSNKGNDDLDLVQPVE